MDRVALEDGDPLDVIEFEGDLVALLRAAAFDSESKSRRDIWNDEITGQYTNVEKHEPEPLSQASMSSSPQSFVEDIDHREGA